MYEAAQAAAGAEGAASAGGGPSFTKESTDDGVVDAEVVDEGPEAEEK
jgi:hypothetical protein